MGLDGLASKRDECCTGHYGPAPKSDQCFIGLYGMASKSDECFIARSGLGSKHEEGFMVSMAWVRKVTNSSSVSMAWLRSRRGHAKQTLIPSARGRRGRECHARVVHLACWCHEQENSAFVMEMEAFRAEGHCQQDEIRGQVFLAS